VRAYDYDLPRDLIAQTPATPRDASRLLIYNPRAHDLMHRHMYDLPDVLRADDVLVVNDCRVLPARLFARRAQSGGMVELLLTRRCAATRWEAMVRPGRACRPGAVLHIADTTVHVLATLPDGQRIVQFDMAPAIFDGWLEDHGVTPLPPYISRPHGVSDPADRARYQTVYARDGHAVAAPTAGLHFTDTLLAALRAKGCSVLALTLHVGIGTFKPVTADDVRRHVMHAEDCSLSPAIAAELNTARARGRRIIAVGTTVLRTLEHCLAADGRFQPFSGATDLFIHPPNKIRSIDGLLTNFHLPRSTLLMMVAAWVGPQRWRSLYETAVRARYRFYSYGDAMLLLGESAGMK